MAYDNIKNHKEPRFTLPLEITFLEKPLEGVKLTTIRPPSPPPPSLFRVQKMISKERKHKELRNQKNT